MTAVVGNIVVFINLTYLNPTLAPFLSSQVCALYILLVLWEREKHFLLPHTAARVQPINK